jgi:dienelactone hydrolase
MSGSFQKSKISFISQGITCRGHLYYPEINSGKLPCVVMANGYSGTMDWILPSFAEAFACNGMAVLIFDYRYLGDSDGVPRQLIDPDEQLADLKNAVSFVRHHNLIEKKKIALWGTSLGGSYVITLASQDPDIAAVIGNMPAIDAVKGGNINVKAKKAGVSKLRSITATLQLLGAAVLDAIKGTLGLEPFYIKVYGKPGRAFFTDPELAPRFDFLEQNSSTWQNRTTPRFLFKAPRYRNGTFEKIRTPIQLTLATNDVELSIDFIKDKAKQAQSVEVKEYPYGHFDLYHGEISQQVIKDQVAFLRHHLL